MNEFNDFEEFPLADAIDHDILMHRDAHFGGQFSIMLDYYRQEGKGIQPEFSLERIEKLAALEQAMGQNLAAIYLAGAEMEKVGESREAYKKLRQIYEAKNTKTPIPKLIADLILAEDEEATDEVQAVVAEQGKIVPFLIDLMRNEQFYDPLFPGYGLAPALAAQCLGLIGDKRAIIALFEGIGQSDFFSDDQILKALQEIGEPAKTFLLRVVRGRPLNEDNERAAIALIAFKDDPDVAKTCLNLLQDRDVQKDPCLLTYLVLACAGLQGEDRQIFTALTQDPPFRELKEDMKSIIQGWNE